jgi:hypothetical protein
MYIFQNPFLLPLFVLIYLIVLYFILHLWQFKWIIWCPGRVSSSCSTSDTRRVNLVTNPVISHASRKDRVWFAVFFQLFLFFKYWVLWRVGFLYSSLSLNSFCFAILKFAVFSNSFKFPKTAYVKLQYLVPWIYQWNLKT